MKSLKIEQFKVNKSLAYLIQQSTKDSTQEILSYFHGLSTFVAENVFNKSKARYVNKDIVLFYKETPITFRLQIHCGYIQEFNTAGKVYIKVGFPSQTEDQDITDLMTKVVESGLGLVEEEMAPFEKPILKAPACLRKVRLEQDKQRS